jgi:hypothetical protein
MLIKTVLMSLALMTVASASPAPLPCNQNDRRGCCSHHDGVCGCNRSTNMLRCCDGTQSPSCDCDRAD